MSTHRPIAVVWKKRGQTPLAALEAYRRTHNIDESIPMSYIGRLDPLAEGKLLLAVGKEACQARETLLALDKQYDVVFALGLGSDSGDVFGRLQLEPQLPQNAFQISRALRQIIPHYHGPYSCRYHPFSSKPVTSSKTGERRPLWHFASTDRLSEVGIPSKHTHIHRITLTAVWEQSLTEIAQEAQAALALLETLPPQLKKRLEAARADWQSLSSLPQSLVLVRMRLDVASGLYVRTLVQDIAAQLHTRAVMLSLVRRQIGRYHRFGPFAWYRRPVL